MGDVVAVTRAGQETIYYTVAMIGFVRIDTPSIVNRPGLSSIPLA